MQELWFYIKECAHCWYTDVLAIVGAAMLVLGLVGIHPQITWSIGLLLLFGSLSVAQYRAYQKIRKQTKQAEWEFVRQKNIESASQNLDDLDKVLLDMRNRLRIIVIEHVKKPTDKTSLDKVEQYMSKWGLSPLTPNEDEMLVKGHELAKAMDICGIGLKQIIDSDTKYKRLVHKFENYSIGDKKLKASIQLYRTILEGVYSYKLLYLYSYQNTRSVDIKVKTAKLQIIDALEIFVDNALQRVNARIQELLRGDDPS